MTWPVVIGIVAGCLFLSAFFSGSETGYMSVNRVRLRKGRQENSARGKLLRGQLRQIENPILTCLIGTNLFNVAGSAVLTVALVDQYGRHGEWLAILVGSVLIILLAEIIPKVLFREYPERLTLATAPVIAVASGLLLPVRWLIGLYTALLKQILPASDDADSSSLDRRNLSALLMTNIVPGQDDRRFTMVLKRFMKLANLSLGPIMHPLEDLTSICEDCTVAGCLAVASESGYSRLPIRSQATGQFQAYVLVRDLLFLAREELTKPLNRNLWRSFLLVDVRMSPYELFEELRSRGTQLAMVVDPTGNVLGLITLEDLIETVTGSIADEFDTQ